MRIISYRLFLFLFLLFGCMKGGDVIDITPHAINPHANLYYTQALYLLEQYFDVDSTKRSIELLDKALDVDNLNPDYYGMKAKLFAEMGMLDSALSIQRYANSIGAINGEYLLQLGLFQAAKDLEDEAKKSFKRSNDYLIKVLEVYPDSLGAFVNQQAAYSLHHGVDSLYMNDKSAIRSRFSSRLMDIEMTRRLKPSYLIKQLKKIELDAINDVIGEIDRELYLN